MRVRCPNCRNAIEVVHDDSFTVVECPSCGSKVTLTDEEETTDYRAIKPEVIGHFRLDECLGKGAHGSVFRAMDTELERYVAIKIPRKGELSPAEQALFLREARATAQLNHPNIVSIHEVGRYGESLFIVSDLIDGVNLTEWLSARRPSAIETAEMCRKVASGLHHAHENGVIHRDIKPSNILIDPLGEPRITDFGLAKREGGEITMTLSGQVLGTPAYMPPEQASGRSHTADARSDIYSLGATMYEMLLGKPPFSGRNRMLIQQIVNEPPPRLRNLNKSIPRDLETICLKCLEKEPTNRYASADHLADDLQSFLDKKPIRARPVGRVVSFFRWCRRKPAWATSLAMTVICIVSLAYTGFSRNKQAAEAVKQFNVKVSSDTAGVNTRIVPIELLRGRFAFDRALEIDLGNVASANTRLAPGWYLVECISPEGRIQSVWRNVPESTNERKQFKYRSQNWIADGPRGIIWQPVVFNVARIENADISEQLVMVEGGAFERPSLTGIADIMLERLPASGARQSTFMIGAREITHAEYVAVMGDTASAAIKKGASTAADSPVVNVTFWEALEFCERTGTRLPTLEEYLYVATDGGRIPSPNGTDPSAIEAWDMNPVSGDATMTNRPIYALYSSVAEWTQSMYMPSAGFGQSKKQWPKAMTVELSQSRVVVGGGLDEAKGKPRPGSWKLGPWSFTTVRATDREKSGLGFRVARSLVSTHNL